MISFEQLLSPLPVDAFLKEHWAKRPLFLSGRSSRKFADLPDWPELPGILAQHSPSASGWPPGFQGIVQASYIDAFGRPRRLGRVQVSMIRALLNAGASLCFSALDTNADERLAGLARSLTDHTSIGDGAVVTCYLSPPHSGGPMHFDGQHVFFCQVSGRKQWRISDAPAVQAANFNLAADEMGPPVGGVVNQHGREVVHPDNCRFLEIPLEAHDVLYLPPGVWHEARTFDSHSFHYTLTLEPYGFFALMQSVLRIEFLQRPTWTEDMNFIEHLGMSREQYLAERLAELRSAIGEMTPESLLTMARESSLLKSLTGIR
jgi:ribosomal protein L16 Arg81 hydroxylase